MTTVSLKIEDEKLRLYRHQAKAVGLTLSEFILRKIDGDDTHKNHRYEQDTPEKPKGHGNSPTPRLVKAKYSGVMVFAGDPSYVPLTNESVKEMLSDFP